MLELDGRRLTLGRNERADLRLTDPEVSGIHALFESDGEQTVVSDLGSTNGTTLNGAPVGSEGRPLRNGDVLGFANVQLRFEDGSGHATRPWGSPAPAAAAATTYRAGDYHIGSQTGGQINNVEGAQYNYIRQVTEQRESFLREIAATKTKARRLIWIGFALFILGGGTYFLVFARAASQMSDFISEIPADPSVPVDPEMPDVFGTDAGGMPLGILGFGVAAVGVVLMLVGLVLHIVAASRRKQLETAPAPWQGAGPSGSAW